MSGRSLGDAKSDIFEIGRMRQPYSSNNIEVNMDRFYNFISRPEAGGYERSLRNNELFNLVLKRVILDCLSAD